MDHLHSPYAADRAASLTVLAPITTSVRMLNPELWELLTRPGPLTAQEWAFIEEQERQGQEHDHAC